MRRSSSFPGVLEAAAVGVPDRYLGEDLVAFAVLRSGVECDERDILRFCESRLGHFKTPTRVFFVETLPKGPSGKVQRIGLLEAAKRLATSAIGGLSSAPSGADDQAANGATPVEQAITEIWARYLTRGPADLSSNFFALGGHSLTALQCLSGVRESLRVVVSLKEFFENPTVASQAALIRGRLGLQQATPPSRDGAFEGQPPETIDALAPVPARDHASPSPLSLSQERIWFMDQLNDGTPVYNEPDAVRLRGPLSPDLEDSLNIVIGRHQILRTTVRMLGDEPSAVVQEDWRLRLKQIDLSCEPPSRRDDELKRLLIDEPRLPFSLGAQPGIRATLIRLGPGDHVLIVMMHHMICDRASMGVLWREFSDAYRAGVSGSPLQLPSLPIQFGDYAVWQRLHADEQDLAEDLDYWQQKLGGAAPAGTAGRPAASERLLFPGRSKTFLGPADVGPNAARVQSARGRYSVHGIRGGAEHPDLPLHRPERILVGIPLSERDRPELQPMIGFLLHTHVLQTALCGDMSFRQLLFEVEGTVLELYDQRSPPFDRL